MTPSRNALCPCGSGLRYKQCCGSATASPAPASPTPRASLASLLREGSQSGWNSAALQQALRQAVSASLKEPFGASRRIADSPKMRSYRDWRDARGRESRAGLPLVSIVVPSYNHARFVGDCLASICRQSYPNIEVIVIDDGSRDGSPATIRDALERCPFPSRFVARENRGAHATINEGVALAGGEYFNVVNSDDRIAPHRIGRMVAAVANAGADWGFSGVELIDGDGRVAPRLPGSMAEGLAAISARASSPTVSLALLRSNASISTGNLFVRKAFFERIGGFAPLRYHHDWEFALRASLSSEAVHVPEPLYEYRLHETNTTWEEGSGAREEGTRMLGGHFHTLLDAAAVAANEFAPTFANWGEDLLGYIVDIGFEKVLPFAQVRGMATLLLRGTV